MNKNTLKTSLRTLIVLLTVALVAQGVAAADETTDSCLLYTSDAAAE